MTRPLSTSPLSSHPVSDRAHLPPGAPVLSSPYIVPDLIICIVIGVRGPSRGGGAAGAGFPSKQRKEAFYSTLPGTAPDHVKPVWPPGPWPLASPVVARVCPSLASEPVRDEETNQRAADAAAEAAAADADGTAATATAAAAAAAAAAARALLRTPYQPPNDPLLPPLVAAPDASEDTKKAVEVRVVWFPLALGAVWIHCCAPSATTPFLEYRRLF